MKLFSIKIIQVNVLLLLSISFLNAQEIGDLELFERLDHIEHTETAKTDTLQMYLQNAQYRQAITYINSLEPNKDLLYQKALCYRSLNEISMAIEILNDLSENFPEDVPAKLQLALCYEIAAKYSKSIECYNKLILLDSTNTYFAVRKADIFYRSEKYILAIDAYLKIDSIYNPNYIARCVAMCYEKMNMPEEAKYYYGKAWELDLQDAYSANSLVKIFVKEEDYSQALIFSEQFLTTDSTNTTMNALNAFIIYNLNNYELALERFEKCLQRGDSSLIVNSSLGYIYNFMGKDSIARPFLQQAFSQDSNNDKILYILGKVNFNLKYYNEAADCFKKIIEKSLNAMPSNDFLFLLYKDLAKSYEKAEDYKTALDAYNTTLRYRYKNIDRMEIFYAMAVISEEKLMNYNFAVTYYKQYHVCLLNYKGALGEEDEQEIKKTEEMLNALEKHINLLTEKAKNNN